MADFTDNNQQNLVSRASLNKVARTVANPSTAIPDAAGALTGKANESVVITKGTNPDNPMTVLTSDDGWLENDLNDFRSVTYHARLFMTDDEPFDIGSFGSYDALYRYITETKKQTTIAESGKTGLNITSFELSSIQAPNAGTRSMMSTSATVNIIEPMGVSFMDMLADSALELGINNFSKTCFFLEVSFQGWDESGDAADACTDYPNKGKWLFHLFLQNIDSEVTSNGGSYRLTFIPYEERVQDMADLCLPDAVMPEGATVGEMLTDLMTQLNRSVTTMYGYQFKKYDFKIKPGKKDGKVFDPTTFKITPLKPTLNDKRTYTMDAVQGTNKIKAHFAHGTTINDAIELIFANSEEMQRLAKDNEKQDEIEVDGEKFRSCVVYRCHPVAKAGEYDYALEQYTIEYTFVLKPYLTQKPILTANQVKTSQKASVQAANAQMLRTAGYLAKRFDYIFTGKNTEVINFDIKLNTPWCAYLPRIAGFNNSKETSGNYFDLRDRIEELKQKQLMLAELQARIDEAVTIKADIDQLQAKQQRSSSEEQRLKELQAKSPNVRDTFTLTEKQTALQREAAELHDKIQAEGKRTKKPINPARSTIRYSEEVVDSSDPTDFSPTKISLAQNPNDPRFSMSGSMPDSFTRDRAIMGAVMDQLYDNVEANLQNINLEIRGDPYWLGASNLERAWANLTQASVPQLLTDASDVEEFGPDYSKGDTMFLLTFRYPRGVDNRGNPIIKTNDFFTGVYMAIKVTHKFNGGAFTQTLQAIRQPLIDVYRAFGFRTQEELTNNQKAREQLAENQREMNRFRAGNP